MIVPADAAEMTKGKPYVGLAATRVAAVVVAKIPLLAFRCRTRDQRLACLAVTSHQVRSDAADSALVYGFLSAASIGVFAQREAAYSSLPEAEAVRIDSTTVASASVVVSPRGWPFAMSRSRRR